VSEPIRINAAGLENTDPLGLVDGVFDNAYRIVRAVGTGGFGVVYEAERLQLRDRVALKVLRIEQFREPETVIERFWREARASASLADAGAVEIYDARVEQPNGRLYYSMELLQGVSLFHRWMASPDRRMPVVEALGCIRQVAACIAVAHDAGIIHRDLKPANIFLGRDHRVRVLDFGIALVQSESRLTTPGQILGVSYYMPPDQLDYLRRGAPDPRVDIYALGVTLYHVLAGRYVYPLHPDSAVVAKNVLLGPPPDIADVAPFLPAPVQALIRRAMARNPEDRYQTMRELEEAITRLLRNGAVELRVPADASTLARTAPGVPSKRTLLGRLLSKRITSEGDEDAKTVPRAPAAVQQRAENPDATTPPVLRPPQRAESVAPARTPLPAPARTPPPAPAASSSSGLRVVTFLAASALVIAGAALVLWFVDRRNAPATTTQAAPEPSPTVVSRPAVAEPPPEAATRSPSPAGEPIAVAPDQALRRVHVHKRAVTPAPSTAQAAPTETAKRVDLNGLASPSF
jgi:serine/threonine protein kinase